MTPDPASPTSPSSSSQRRRGRSTPSQTPICCLGSQEDPVKKMHYQRDSLLELQLESEPSITLIQMNGTGSSRRRPRLKKEAIKDDSSRMKKETIKDDGGSSRRKPRLKEEAIKHDSSRRGQWLKKKTIKDDDSDDFVLTDTEEVECVREMTQAEMEAYCKQVEETGGFDAVDVPTNVIDCDLIRPNLN